MGTVTFQNTDTMLRVKLSMTNAHLQYNKRWNSFQMSGTNPVGTIAFILDEEALLVRVNKGWQYIAVSCDVMSVVNHSNDLNLFSARNFATFGNTTHDNHIDSSFVRPWFTGIESVKQQQYSKISWELHG